MILRLLGWQGIAGLVAASALALLLLIQKSETRHWRRQSGQYEQLYRSGEAALAGTIANYRAAADRARAADQANSSRVAAAQAAITERTADEYQNRLDDARARARAADVERLRRQGGAAAADPGARRAAPVPGVADAAGDIAPAAGEDRFPYADRLTATEQAIQLDELIKWVRRQQAVSPHGAAPLDPKR